MRFGVVGDLVTHAGFQGECPAILKFCLQFALQTKQDMAFVAPVIGKIARRVFDHANADVAELTRPPESLAVLAGVFGGFDS